MVHAELKQDIRNTLSTINNYDLYFKVFSYDEAIEQCILHAKLKLKRHLDSKY